MPRSKSRALSGVNRIDSATCKRLLEQYLRVGYSLQPYYFSLDQCEFRAVVEDAILEAYLSYKPSHGTREETWVRRVLHWRLSEAVRRNEHLAWDRTADELDIDPQIANGLNPERAFWQAHAVAALAELSPRHHTIVVARMHGETYAEVAETLGISTARAQAEGAKALELLREILETPDRGRR